MQVTVSEKMKEWVAGYIRSHRKEGTISIHVVYSKFNEDFRATFNVDPQVAIRLMEESGFLKGCRAKGGYSIWLPEDAGKGKSRPYRSRTQRVNGAASATAETKSAVPIKKKKETGEIEMKTKTKDDISIEPLYVFEKIPHPETGQVDVLELIRYIMKFFDESLPNKPDMDGGYSVIKMRIHIALASAGIPSGSWPELSRIMQEMGLIKSYGKSQWGVLHNKAANYFITARSYLVAREAMLERRKRNRKIARLEKKVKKLESSTTQTQETSRADDDLAIEALALAELYEEERDAAKAANSQLEARVAELSTKVRQLEGKLADREDARTALAEQIAAKKAALKKV